MENAGEDFKGVKVVNGRYTEEYIEYRKQKDIEASANALKNDRRSSEQAQLVNLRQHLSSLQNAEEKARQNWIMYRGQFDELIVKHFRALRKGFRQALIVNDYGGIEQDLRPEETIKFLQGAGVEGAHYYRVIAKEIAIYIQAKIDADISLSSVAGFDFDSFPTDGLEFEHWVASALKVFEWDAKVTQGSGDQGIDVVAVKGGISLGIQCKVYSGAVGNSAVQQVIAGARFYGLNNAAVISNSPFTKSAQDLAGVSKVLLVSPHDIPFLEKYVLQQT